MVAYADVKGKNQLLDEVDAPRVEATFWGYILAGKEAPGYINQLIRWVAMFFGVSFIFAAMGFWLVPASSIAADILMLKLACSAFFLLTGATLLQLGQDAGKPEVQVDLHRKEIRFLNRSRNGTGKLVHVFGFEEISKVDVEDGQFKSLGANDRKLASFAIAHAFDHELKRKFANSAQPIH